MASDSQDSSENLAEFHAGAYGWLSPRISFSTDFGLGSRAEAEAEAEEEEEHRHNHHRRQPLDATEWSQEFEFSLAIECPCGSPADEIFYQGKLLPLHQVVDESGSTGGIHLVKELLFQEGEGGKCPGAGISSAKDEPRSCEPSTSPLVVSSDSSPGSPSKLPTCSTAFKDLFGLRRNGNNNRYSLRFLSLLFRRTLVSVAPPKSLSQSEKDESERDSDDPESPSASTSPSPQETSPPTGGRGATTLTREELVSVADATVSKQVKGNTPMNSGRILWKNLERCSKSCGKAAVRRGDNNTAGGGGAGIAGTTPAPPPPPTTTTGSSPGSPFSSNVRVAPVLNVPMCMGPVKETKSTMAGLRKMFTVKKGSLHRVTWACPGGAI